MCPVQTVTYVSGRSTLQILSVARSAPEKPRKRGVVAANLCAATWAGSGRVRSLQAHILHSCGVWDLAHRFSGIQTIIFFWK